LAVPFAKSANGFAQEDKFGREARTTGNDKDNGSGGGWDAVWWRSGFLRCAAHGDTVSSFGRTDDFWVTWKRTGKDKCSDKCDGKSDDRSERRLTASV
jgi:hypothetical protein